MPLYFDYVEIPTGFDTAALEYMLSDESITIASPTSLDKIDRWHLGYVAIKDIKPGEDIEFESFPGRGGAHFGRKSGFRIGFHSRAAL